MSVFVLFSMLFCLPLAYGAQCYLTCPEDIFSSDDDSLELNTVKESRVVVPGSAQSIRRKKANRVQQLIPLLRGKGTSFAALEDSLYKGVSKRSFHTDVLAVMREGYVVSCESDNFFIKGEKDVAADSRKQVGVERAMFDCIRDGVTGFLELKMAMYNSGFRSYAPDVLDDIEAVLRIADVYPYPKRCSALIKHCQSFWRDNEHLGFKEFDSAMGGFDDNSKRILRKLKRFKDSEGLDTLKVLKKQSESLSVFRKSTPGGGHQDVILKNWHRFFGQEFKVSELINALGIRLPAKVGPVRFILKVLRLHLDGCLSVLYDKDGGKMQPLERKDVLVESPGSATFEIKMYELLSAYGKNILIEELAYYACHFGFAEPGDRLGLLKRIYQYRDFLVILEKVDTGVLAASQCSRLKHQIRLWDALQTQEDDEGFMDCKSCGVKGVTAEDERVMGALKDFVSSEEYHTLEQYIASQNVGEKASSCESFVEYLLTEAPHSVWALRAACKEEGVEEGGFWPLMKRLAERKGPGCLYLRPEDRKFVWLHDRGCKTAPGQCFILPTLSLIKASPHVEYIMLTHFLYQEGYAHAHVSEVRRHVGCFEIMGLIHGRLSDGEETLAVRRAVLNMMIEEKVIHPSDYYMAKFPDLRKWMVRYCQIIFFWWQKGFIFDLWDHYLQQKPGGAVSQEGRFRPRLVRFCGKAASAQTVLKKEIPALYAILCPNAPLCDAECDVVGDEALNDESVLGCPKKDCAIEVFRLRAQKNMSARKIIENLLRNKVPNVTEGTVKSALFCLEVCGLVKQKRVGCFTHLCQSLIDLMVQEQSNSNEVISAAKGNVTKWVRRVSNRSFAWISNGTMVQLWKNLDLYGQSGDVWSDQCRRHFESAKMLVCRQMPALYHYLEEAGAFAQTQTFVCDGIVTHEDPMMVVDGALPELDPDGGDLLPPAKRKKSNEA